MAVWSQALSVVLFLVILILGHWSLLLQGVTLTSVLLGVSDIARPRRTLEGRMDSRARMRYHEHQQHDLVCGIHLHHVLRLHSPRAHRDQVGYSVYSVEREIKNRAPHLRRRPHLLLCRVSISCIPLDVREADLLTVSRRM